jgi:hypothetical protein
MYSVVSHVPQCSAGFTLDGARALSRCKHGTLHSSALYRTGYYVWSSCRARMRSAESWLSSGPCSSSTRRRGSSLQNQVSHRLRTQSASLAAIILLVVVLCMLYIVQSTELHSTALHVTHCTRASSPPAMISEHGVERSTSMDL